ncbi:PepSY-like domain-containing protein [Sediminicola luteus]|uniref:PepSY-like domain-containing protein n=1 Tax=Sediminicola luteus TaxID=319238 RepID=A0ABV2TWZ0_9FLAO
MALSLLRIFRNKKSQVSPFVFVAFSSQFPRATDLVWHQVGLLKWQVSFTLNKKKCTALFNRDGQWLETVTAMPLQNLPDQLQLSLQEKYTKKDHKQIYHVQTPNRSHYEMSSTEGSATIKLLFDLTGNIVGRLLM